MQMIHISTITSTTVNASETTQCATQPNIVTSASAVNNGTLSSPNVISSSAAVSPVHQVVIDGQRRSTLSDSHLSESTGDLLIYDLLNVNERADGNESLLHILLQNQTAHLQICSQQYQL